METLANVMKMCEGGRENKSKITEKDLDIAIKQQTKLCIKSIKKITFMTVMEFSKLEFLYMVKADTTDIDSILGKFDISNKEKAEWLENNEKNVKKYAADLFEKYCALRI